MAKMTWRTPWMVATTGVACVTFSFCELQACFADVHRTVDVCAGDIQQFFRARYFCHTNKDGHRHFCSSTVRTRLHNIYGKLGVKDRAQAVLNAAENGWL